MAHSNKIPLLLVRADATPSSGSGHVMRMLALAQAWQRRGGEVVFSSIEMPDILADRLNTYHVVIGAGIIQGSAQDAEWTVSIARKFSAQCLVADGYKFGADFQKTVRKAGLRFTLICDFPVTEEISCELLINQNLGASASDYPLLDPGATALFGPDFAMLRAEFAGAKRKNRAPRGGKGKRLLITLGGSDPANLSERILKALGPHAAQEGWHVTLLVGPLNPGRAKLEEIATRFQGVECLAPVSDMLNLLARFDAVISAGGSTCWEICFLGLPMAVISIAANQNGIIAALGNVGAALNLGWHSELDETVIVQVAKTLLNDAECRPLLSSAAIRLVDGRGADRVAAAIHGGLKIALATAKDGWVIQQLSDFVEGLRAKGHEVLMFTDTHDIPKVDLVFYLSFWSLADAGVLERATHSLVVHASDLPMGKGWSPMTWQVLAGESRIPVRLFEAEPSVDSGDIHGAMDILLEGHELVDELRNHLMEATTTLCSNFVNGYPRNVPLRRTQVGESTSYARRVPADSCIDPEASLVAQFNLLRTVDNAAYPAFFEHLGHFYELHIYKRTKS